MTKPLRLMTLAPGHFHAALVQARILPGIHPKAYVYAPLDDDLVQHLARLAAFNTRPDDPTDWEVDVRAGTNYFERFLREQPGNVAVIAGRNRPKIDRILACVANNLSVLADKPWVIDPDDFPKLEELFREADLREVIAADVMTERFEVTNVLLRELIRDPEVFGDAFVGSRDHPALHLESTHYLKKVVSGAPLRRPAWWFDPVEAGDGLADVGTHLADQALWLLFPDEPIDYRQEVRVLDADRWPTPVDRETFQAVTGQLDFPAPLRSHWVSGHILRYFGNGAVSLTVRGVHVRITVVWDLEAEHGAGDAHEAVARGTRATVSIKPEPENGHLPGVFVTPAAPADQAGMLAAVRRRCGDWGPDLPGIEAEDAGDHIRLNIPAALRTGHESHFMAVMREFIRYFHFPRSIPAWERENLLARYYITTRAAWIARRKTDGG
jgi:predicted dehydrogenase